MVVDHQHGLLHARVILPGSGGLVNTDSRTARREKAPSENRIAIAILVFTDGRYRIHQYARAPPRARSDGSRWLALVVLFVVREGRIANPMMPLRLFPLPQRRRGEHRAGIVRRRHVREFFLGAIGLAVLATLATTRTDSLLADGESSAEALTSGYHLAFLIGAVLVIVAIAVALTVLRPPAVVEQAEADGDLASPEPAYSEAA
jgi:hypothetical protein